MMVPSGNSSLFTTQKKLLIYVYLILIPATLLSQHVEVGYLHGNNYIKSIVVDSNRIWVGGYLGLSIIDLNDNSIQQKITKPFNQSRPRYGSCYNISVAKDQYGNFFLSNSSSIFEHNKVTNDFFVIDSNESISDFVVDKSGCIWHIGNWNEIVKIENNTKTVFTSSNSQLPENTFYTCLHISDDHLWIGTTDRGLIKFQGGAATIYNSDNSGIPHDNISSISSDNEGNIWFSCWHYGWYPYYMQDHTVGKYDGSNWQSFTSSNSGLPVTSINKIKVIDNDIFICSHDGLIIFDGVYWEIIDKNSHDIISNNVTTIATKGSRLIIGTDAGLSIIGNSSVKNIKTAPATFNGILQGPIAEDLDGNIWVGTSGTFGNLSMYNGSSWTEVIEKGTLQESRSFRSIAIDKNNVVWATTQSFDGGLYRIDGDSIHMFTENNSPLPRFVGDIVIDSKNNKWITSDEDLICYTDSTWIIYDKSNCEKLYNIRCIAIDSQDNIWLGIGQEGMLSFDGKTWIHYDDSFFGNQYSEVNRLFTDKNDLLWIDYSHGTIEPNVGSFDGETLIWYGEDINLPVKGMGLLAVDHNGDLWYSSENGISTYDWNNWTEYTPENSEFLNNQFWVLFFDSNNNGWFSSDCYVGVFNMDSINQNQEEFIPTETNELLIYPNPASSNIIVEFPLIINGSYHCEVFDLSGRKVYSQALSGNTYQINTTNLPGGIYMAVISSPETQKIMRSKFVIR